MPLDTSISAWNAIVKNATEFFKNGVIWKSPKHERFYSIKSVTDKKITIQRISGGDNSEFGEAFFLERIAEINEHAGRIRRIDFGGHVAKMAAIVQLHPFLVWGDNNDLIIEKKFGLPDDLSLDESILEAPNDFEKWQIIARRLRRGQAQFRGNLLRVYNGRCCISGVNIDAVLNAAHIYPHSKCGINEYTNGLILRSDIHDLFDGNLIAIEPDTLKVYVHGDLKSTEYWQFNKKQIASRSDGQKPSTTFLEIKWKQRKT